MRRQEAMLMLDLDAHHRSLRRCHGCGEYARPAGEAQGRLLCERCLEKARREPNETEIDLNEMLET
jgi:formylmethanofuran dehydrogenase subunit E